MNRIVTSLRASIVQAALPILVAGAGAYLFRLGAILWAIPLALLAAFAIDDAIRHCRPNGRAWIRGVVAGSAGTIVVLLTAAPCIFRVVDDASAMTNQVYAEVRSPDRRYVATFAYHDGLTYGYYFVSLQQAEAWRPLQVDDSIPKDEVVEVAAEGLDDVHWIDDHTLAVIYQKSGVEAAEFVKKTARWRDVRIVYRGE